MSLYLHHHPSRFKPLIPVSSHYHRVLSTYSVLISTFLIYYLYNYYLLDPSFYVIMFLVYTAISNFIVFLVNVIVLFYRS